MAGEDPEHLAWIRRQPCDAREAGGCFGDVQAHHRTGAGMGTRAHDLDTIPLCLTHHSDFHELKGQFRYWDKAKRRAWQDERVAHYKLMALNEDVF